MIPDSHPRAQSLHIRDLLVEGVEKGLTAPQGLTAHGRGEAFDYLIDEKTQPFALTAIKHAAFLLKNANHPVLSINGNVAVLAPKEFIDIAKKLDAPIEVNIFHPSKQREQNIYNHLKEYGAQNVLLPDKGTIIGIDSNRKQCHQDGIEKADVILVPLEDGDRCEALIAMGKKVITIDLNPLSRTAQKATITIVDNLVRALPLISNYLDNPEEQTNYDNENIRKEAITFIRTNKFTQ